MSVYFINDAYRKVHVKGIPVITNTENKAVIGLKEDGERLVELIREGETIDVHSLNEKQK